MSNLESIDKEINCEGSSSYKTKIPISFYLALSTFIFSYAGFLYAKTYYSIFGVQVGRYFALEDYIRNSIDVLYMAIFPVVSNVVFLLVVNPSKLGERLAHFKLGKARGEGVRTVDRKFNGLLLLVIFVIVLYISPIFICIYEFYRGGSEKYIFYAGSAIFYSVQFFLIAKEKRFFGLNAMDWFFLTNFFGFLIAVYFFAQFGGHVVKEKAFPGKYLSKPAGIVQYEFKTNYVPGNFLYVGSTSQFIFLFVKEGNYTLVIPISDFVKAKINLKTE